MPVSALDYSTMRAYGMTRKIALQDAANKTRLITMPTRGKNILTLGPVYETDGFTVSGSHTLRFAFALTAGTYTNNDDPPAMADEAFIMALEPGESRSIELATGSRFAEMIVWSDLADAYFDMCYEPKL